MVFLLNPTSFIQAIIDIWNLKCFGLRHDEGFSQRETQLSFLGFSFKFLIELKIGRIETGVVYIIQHYAKYYIRGFPARKMVWTFGEEE